jgi:hypothetical protein
MKTARKLRVGSSLYATVFDHATPQGMQALRHAVWRVTNKQTPRGRTDRHEVALGPEITKAADEAGIHLSAGMNVRSKQESIETSLTIMADGKLQALIVEEASYADPNKQRRSLRVHYPEKLSETVRASLKRKPLGEILSLPDFLAPIIEGHTIRAIERWEDHGSIIISRMREDLP